MITIQEKDTAMTVSSPLSSPPRQETSTSWSLSCEQDTEEDGGVDSSKCSSSNDGDDGTESTVQSDSSSCVPGEEDTSFRNEVLAMTKSISLSSIDSSSSTTSSSSSYLEEDGSEAFAMAKAASKSMSRRPSIKMSSLREDIYVVSKRGSWRQLPMPDMEKVRHSVSLPLQLDVASSELSHNNKKSLQVSFREVSVRLYDQCIGDNPSVSYGPPIQLDWKFDELSPVAIDEYENVRDPQRVRKGMALSYYQRIAILQNLFGCTEDELKKAHKTADREKLKRAVTKAFLPAQKVEEVFQSAGRKTKRYLERRRHSSAL